MTKEKKIELIDRQLLLEKMDERYKEKESLVMNNLAEGFFQMEKLIKEQPIVNNDHSWIPCCKDLPKDSNDVFVLLGYTYDSDRTFPSVARYIDFGNDEKHWCDTQYGYLEWPKYSDSRGGCSSYKVIAWCPVPKLHLEDIVLNS